MNERLATQVFELVASLGMQPRLSVGRATLKGVDCGPKYRVFFTPTFSPFKLPRKTAGVRSTDRKRRIAHRAVVSIDRVPSVPVRCIAVDSPTHQFLIGRAFVPTHNSNWIDALLVNLAKQHGWGFAMFSPENQPLEDHMSRIMEKYTGQPFADGPTPRMSRDARDIAESWVSDHFTWMLPEDDSEWTIDNILDRARQLVYRKGITGIVIDPWNELEDQCPAGQTETQYISQSLKRIRQFGRRYSVHVWVVVHPSKLYKDKEGNYPVPTLYDCSGSAHWRNKADNGICIWRDLSGRNSAVEVHVQKIRFRQIGQLGMCELRYQAATGTYMESL